MVGTVEIPGCATVPTKQAIRDKPLLAMKMVWEPRNWKIERIRGKDPERVRFSEAKQFAESMMNTLGKNQHINLTWPFYFLH